MRNIWTIYAYQDIEIGEDWHKKIQGNLESAKVAVLLVSPAFLVSTYIRNSELPILLKRAKTQGVVILPIILRPCLFQTSTFRYPDPVSGPEKFSLAELQASNPPNKALSELDEAKQDRVLLSVAERIQKIFQHNRDDRASTDTAVAVSRREETRKTATKNLAELNRERMIKRVRAFYLG
jgi:hypothetical protein